jgi:hypothetical protein
MCRMPRPERSLGASLIDEIKRRRGIYRYLWDGYTKDLVNYTTLLPFKEIVSSRLIFIIIVISIILFCYLKM